MRFERLAVSAAGFFIVLGTVVSHGEGPVS
jgi:hypothetical protein